MFWIGGASQGGGIFWVFGLLPLSFGALAIYEAIFGDTVTRRSTWYTLSNRRAFIASRHFGRKRLRIYPIDPTISIDLQLGPPDTVYFIKETYRDDGETKTRSVGFEMVQDGRELAAKIREIQKALN